MRIGKFDESRRRILVEGQLYIVRLDRLRPVEFLLDTGADRTVLPAEVALDFGYDFTAAPAAKIATKSFAGESKLIPERAVLIVEAAGIVHYHAVEIGVRVPDSATRGIPPIIGLDILSQWKVTFCHADGLVECLPINPTLSVRRGIELPPHPAEVSNKHWL